METGTELKTFVVKSWGMYNLRVVRAALDRGAEHKGWWSGVGRGLCHSPSRVIGSRCEAAWPLRQQGVRDALRAQPRADGIAETEPHTALLTTGPPSTPPSLKPSSNLQHFLKHCYSPNSYFTLDLDFCVDIKSLIFFLRPIVSWWLWWRSIMLCCLFCGDPDCRPTGDE